MSSDWSDIDDFPEDLDSIEEFKYSDGIAIPLKARRVVGGIDNNLPKINPATGRLQCKYCEKSFKSNLTYRLHEKTHTGKGAYYCVHEGCNKVFGQRSHFIGHMATHGSVRPFACEFEGCDHSYKDRSAYRKHQLKKHNCRPCDLRRSNFANLRRNMHDKILTIPTVPPVKKIALKKPQKEPNENLEFLLPEATIKEEEPLDIKPEPQELEEWAPPQEIQIQVEVKKEPVSEVPKIKEEPNCERTTKLKPTIRFFPGVRIQDQSPDSPKNPARIFQVKKDSAPLLPTKPSLGLQVQLETVIKKEPIWEPVQLRKSAPAALKAPMKVVRLQAGELNKIIKARVMPHVSPPKATQHPMISIPPVTEDIKPDLNDFLKSVAEKVTPPRVITPKKLIKIVPKSASPEKYKILVQNQKPLESTAEEVRKPTVLHPSYRLIKPQNPKVQVVEASKGNKKFFIQMPKAQESAPPPKVPLVVHPTPEPWVPIKRKVLVPKSHVKKVKSPIKPLTPHERVKLDFKRQNITKQLILVPYSVDEDDKPVFVDSEIRAVTKKAPERGPSRAPSPQMRQTPSPQLKLAPSPPKVQTPSPPKGQTPSPPKGQTPSPPKAQAPSLPKVPEKPVGKRQRSPSPVFTLNDFLMS